MRVLCLIILDFVFIMPVRLLYRLYNRQPPDYETDDTTDELENEIEYLTTTGQAMPEMQQIITIPDNPDIVIGIESIQMCPDETAFIRIITDDAYSQIYKRKVHRTKSIPYDRYIRIDRQDYYIRDTVKCSNPQQPRGTKQ